MVPSVLEGVHPTSGRISSQREATVTPEIRPKHPPITVIPFLLTIIKEFSPAHLLDDHNIGLE